MLVEEALDTIFGKVMVTIRFNEYAIRLKGSVPRIGSKAPDFTLTKANLVDITLEAINARRIILNIFPSIDSPACAQSARKFNAAATELDNVYILCISADLPFAINRFCMGEGLTCVQFLSSFRYPNFGKNYGVKISKGPLSGLLARCVMVLDENKHVIYSELVKQLEEEPDYERPLLACN
ncbi:thiol peroxidase [Candidiatus Paracoxiella cheracis]|uniref:thiol peroxidase n=1 Tax=Candidiatus Paracoxiella cheracis TaxID=3405120 RepID=UPI003BF52069